MARWQRSNTATPWCVFLCATNNGIMSHTVHSQWNVLSFFSSRLSLGLCLSGSARRHKTTATFRCLYLAQRKTLWKKTVSAMNNKKCVYVLGCGHSFINNQIFVQFSGLFRCFFFFFFLSLSLSVFLATGLKQLLKMSVNTFYLLVSGSLQWVFYLLASVDLMITFGRVLWYFFGSVFLGVWARAFTHWFPF